MALAFLSFDSNATAGRLIIETRIKHIKIHHISSTFVNLYFTSDMMMYHTDIPVPLGTQFF